MNDSNEKFTSIINKIEDDYSADVILYSGSISKQYDNEVISCCHETLNDNVIFILCTFGGDAHIAYRIARCLQKRYKYFFICIPSYCKSAGTLVALGANEIIMSEFAEIGPIDVQLIKIDELGERSSGLTIKQALSTLQTEAFSMFEDYFLDLRFRSGGQISTKSAFDAATNLTVGLFSGIYSQIDPTRLGEFDRAVRIALEYGKRLSNHTDNLKKDTIKRLIAEYPDHSFIIDFEESKELFNKISQPKDSLKELLDLNEEFIAKTINQDAPAIINITKIIQEKTSSEINEEKTSNIKPVEDLKVKSEDNLKEENKEKENGDQTNDEGDTKAQEGKI